MSGLNVPACPSQVGLAAGQDLPDPEEHGLPGHLLLDVRAAGADAGGGQEQGGTCQRPGSREAERFFGMSQGIERNRRDHRVEFLAFNHLITI